MNKVQEYKVRIFSLTIYKFYSHWIQVSPFNNWVYKNKKLFVSKSSNWDWLVFAMYIEMSLVAIEKQVEAIEKQLYLD